MTPIEVARAYREMSTTDAHNVEIMVQIEKTYGLKVIADELYILADEEDRNG